MFGIVLNMLYKFLKNTEQPLHRVEVHQPHQLLNQLKLHLHEVGAIKDTVDERLANLRRINLQDVLVVMHQLYCNLELTRLERLLETLNDQRTAVSARLVQLFSISEIPNHVEDVVECTN